MSGKQYSKELKLGHFLCLSVRKTRSGQFREVVDLYLKLTQF